MFEFILWGATGQAIVLEELLSNQNSKIIALFDNNNSIASPFSHIPLFFGKRAFEDWLYQNEKNEMPRFLVAIGGNHGHSRKDIFQYLESKGLIPQTVIHSTAFIAYNSQIGKGCQILAQSSVCAKAVLGDSVIINTGASIDHESFIGDYTHIAPNATICGSVIIENKCFIGANATILPKVRIGENSIIGAGAVVTKDVKSNSIMVGNPARLLIKK